MKKQLFSSRHRDGLRQQRFSCAGKREQHFICAAASFARKPEYTGESIVIVYRQFVKFMLSLKTDIITIIKQDGETRGTGSSPHMKENACVNGNFRASVHRKKVLERIVFPQKLFERSPKPVSESIAAYPEAVYLSHRNHDFRVLSGQTAFHDFSAFAELFCSERLRKGSFKTELRYPRTILDSKRISKPARE